MKLSKDMLKKHLQQKMKNKERESNSLYKFSKTQKKQTKNCKDSEPFKDKKRLKKKRKLKFMLSKNKPK